MERKKPSDVIAHPFDQLFSSFDYFNEMQSTLLHDILNTDNSVVLSAPTGSGKTVTFELAIVKMLQCLNVTNKAIYIAPIKALCSEKFSDWDSRFQSVGVKCIQLTGDSQTSDMMKIREAQVVISTPEKWDSLTRWRDFEQILLTVQLFIIDEVHLLNEDIRGPIIEAIVARMRTCGVKRFFLASATIPNVEDLTAWMRNYDADVSQHVFSELQRPVPLEKHVVGVNTKLKGFQFDMKLNYQLPDILRKYSESKASLIFCSSRKSTEMAAFNLNKYTNVITLSENQKVYLSKIAVQLTDAKLSKLVENGIAYHHAGLQYADRSIIENSFRQGYLMILLSTSTLAMGINLPAHLVVIKSTETYTVGGYSEYPENMILQMIGRAGRPQYDTKGIAVILTQQKNVQKYHTIMNGKAPIESHLHKHLTEHLNSEIALNTINNLEVTKIWIRSTYLFVRSIRNPKHYGFDADLTKNVVEHKLEELCFQQINALNEQGLITLSNENGLSVQPTIFGKLMSKYYISFETMKIFNQLKGQETLEDILGLVVQCKELNDFTLRVNEKKVLNELNKTPIRFPIKGRIKTSKEKISCIIQAVFGNLEISLSSLIQESLKIMRIGDRISKCLLEYVRLAVQNKESNNFTGWYKTMLNSLIIAKCFHAKLWENSEFASKQLHGIGTTYSRVLAQFGKTSLKSIANTEARTIEHLLNKTAPFGDVLLQNLMNFPEYELNIQRMSTDSIQVRAWQVNNVYMHKSGDVAMLLIGDSFNNILLKNEKLDYVLFETGYFESTIQILKPEEVETIYGHILHINVVGVDVHATLQINTSKNVNDIEIITKKPKRQKRLNVTLSEISLNENSGNKIIAAEKSSTFSDTHTADLQSYTFKPKILNSRDFIIVNETLNQTRESVSVNNTLNSTAISTKLNTTDSKGQRKLTEYFFKNKKNYLLNQKSSNEQITPINLTLIEDKSISTNEPENNLPPRYDRLTQNKFQNNHMNENKTISNNIESIENQTNTESDIKRKASPEQKYCNSKENFNSGIEASKKQKLSDLNSNISSDECSQHTPSLKNTTLPNRSAFTLASFLGDIYPCNESNPMFVPPRSQTSHKLSNSASNVTEIPNRNLNETVDSCTTTPESSNVEKENTSLENDVNQKNSQESVFTIPLSQKADQSFQTFFLDTSNSKLVDESFSNFFNIPDEKCKILDVSIQENIFDLLNKSFVFDCNQKTQNSEQKNSLRIEKVRRHTQNNLSDFKNSDFDSFSSTTNSSQTKTTIRRRTQTQMKMEIENSKYQNHKKPTTLELNLWYKVARQFHRLPKKLHTLSNFQRVHNKVVEKMEQNKKQNGSLNNDSSIYSITSSDSTDENKSKMFDSPSFRLQLFEPEEQKRKFNKTAIKIINQGVMKKVLESKCMENSKFAEEKSLEKTISEYLDDLERELSISSDSDNVDEQNEFFF